MKIAHVSAEGNLVILRLLIFALVRIPELMKFDGEDGEKDEIWKFQATSTLESLQETVIFWCKMPVIRDVESHRHHLEITANAIALLDLDIVALQNLVGEGKDISAFAKDLKLILGDTLLFLEGA